MKKFDNIVICSDIDGTLLTSEHQIHPSNLEAIAYFRENGGKFTIATGRNLRSVSRYAEVLKPDLPIIVANGCAIVDFENGEYLWETSMPAQGEAFVHQIISDFPEVCVALVNHEDTFFLTDSQEGREFRAIEKLPFRMAELEQVSKPWLKLISCQNEIKTGIVRDAYRGTEWEKHFKFVRSGPTYFEALHKNANKGVALKQLAKLCGFSLEKTVALGDNENDCEMLATAGIGCAMGNATAEAKEKADIITSSNNAGGVADLIYKLESLF